MSNRFGCILVVGLCCGAAWAQSSSLYTAESRPPMIRDGKIYNPQLQAKSYTAVSQPEPRDFALHDLVTIIVRESSSSTSEATLDTQKKSDYTGEISDIPKLLEFLELRFKSEDLGADAPKLGVKFNSDFKGEGEYERKDEMVMRITARVIDVKPNGTLALEARKHIKNDDEEMTMTLTGYCRAKDVAADNTILSSLFYDLDLKKNHKGELRKTSKKGLLTKLFDAIFNF